ncbi:MAG: DUF397 domain-containing protein [Streptosporangiaceae bacterium]
MNENRWRTSTYSSSNGGNCVEVADHDHHVIVRDTNDRTGPALRFTPAAWRNFASQVKRPLSSHPTAPTTPIGSALLAEGAPLICPASERPPASSRIATPRGFLAAAPKS